MGPGKTPQISKDNCIIMKDISFATQKRDWMYKFQFDAWKKSCSKYIVNDIVCYFESSPSQL